jgi:hypothetical protein
MRNSKTMRIVSLLLMAAIIVTMLSFGALATAASTATFTYTTGSIATAYVSGGGTGTLAIIDTKGPIVDENDANLITCQVELSPNSTATSATISLKDSSSVEQASATIELSATVPTEADVRTVQTTYGNKTYQFVFVKECSYTGGTSCGSLYIELPDSYVTLGGTSPNFTATTAVVGFPQQISLRIVPGGSNYEGASGISASLTSNSDADTALVHQAGTYYTLEFPTSGSTAEVSVTYTPSGTSTATTVTFKLTLSYSSAATSGVGIYAFLPAPGQFTNEGCNTGGWGDAFVSGSASLKGMVNSLSTTGVSLGYFGGYVVLDMGENISNNANNMFGIDLIAYGNAFNNNSEPGCIQVAQAVDNAPGDANGDGFIWYDIANSLYYDSDTAADASFTYTIPETHYSYNSSTAWPQSGTATSPNATNNVPYVCSPYDALGETEGTVTYNTFHRHEWFPLWANYFVARNTTVGELSKAKVTDNTVSPATTTSGFRFAEYTRDTTNGSTMTLKGVMLKDATVSNNTSLYRFGMADVHPKYGTAGYYDKPYNPYAFANSDLSNWNTYMATAYKDSSTGSPAGGGDPIDISWAVYPARYDRTVTVTEGSTNVTHQAGTVNTKVGQPAGLSNIRFVRIYTGAAKMNGMFGEISTEVCGVYKATGTNTGTTDSVKAIIKHGDTTLSNGGTDITDTQKFISQSITAGTDYTFTVYTSSSNYLYINGTQITGATSSNPHTITINLSAGETKTYQIITQTGLRQPYIEVITFTGSGT